MRLKWRRVRVDLARVPADKINPTRPYKNTRGLSAVTRSGMATFGDLYTWRQLLCIQTYQGLLDRVADQLEDSDLRTATLTVLNCAVSRFVFQNSALTRWHAGLGKIEGAFGKQALQNTWDFAEANPLSSGPACWKNALTWVQKVVDANLVIENPGRVALRAAQDSSCPMTRRTWSSRTRRTLHRSLTLTCPMSFGSGRGTSAGSTARPLHSGLTGKDEEIIVTDATATASGGTKGPEFYQRELTRALVVARRTLAPNGACVVVFADSRTESWEAILGALLEAGWQITASWPLDTEMETRTVRLAPRCSQSSIHLVCRPRENPDGSHRATKLESGVTFWRSCPREFTSGCRVWPGGCRRRGRDLRLSWAGPGSVQSLQSSREVVR